MSPEAAGGPQPPCRIEAGDTVPEQLRCIRMIVTRPARHLAEFASDAIRATTWRLAVIAEEDSTRVIRRLVRATDHALRDDRRRDPYLSRSHRRREDPLLE
jgi:hypothetical protein